MLQILSLWANKPEKIVPQSNISFPIITPNSSGLVSIMYTYVFFSAGGRGRMSSNYPLTQGNS